jgi:hypothetical protein
MIGDFSSHTRVVATSICKTRGRCGLDQSAMVQTKNSTAQVTA